MTAPLIDAGTLWVRLAEAEPNTASFTAAQLDGLERAWLGHEDDDRGPLAGAVYTIPDAPGFAVMHPRASGVIRTGVWER